MRTFERRICEKNVFNFSFRSRIKCTIKRGSPVYRGNILQQIIRSLVSHAFYRRVQKSIKYSFDLLTRLQNLFAILIGVCELLKLLLSELFLLQLCSSREWAVALQVYFDVHAKYNFRKRSSALDFKQFAVQFFISFIIGIWHEWIFMITKWQKIN